MAASLSLAVLAEKSVVACALRARSEPDTGLRSDFTTKSEKNAEKTQLAFSVLTGRRAQAGRVDLGLSLVLYWRGILVASSLSGLLLGQRPQFSRWGIIAKVQLGRAGGAGGAGSTNSLQTPWLESAKLETLHRW